MRKNFLLTACCVSFVLTGCGEISKPLIIKADNGEKLLGATHTSLSAGTFEAMDENGLKCEGSYDQFSHDIILNVSFHCNDGRTGNAIIQRDSSLMNGIGKGKFSDGTRFKLMFGNFTTRM
jgi:hypothetical protein